MATFVMDVIYKTGKRETSAERWHVGNFFCSLAIDDVDEYVEDIVSGVMYVRSFPSFVWTGAGVKDSFSFFLFLMSM